MLSMDQKIDRLGSMAEELHVAKEHLRKAFLEAGGKRRESSQNAIPNRESSFKRRKCYSSLCGVSISGAENRAIEQQAEKLEAREGKQLSVRNTL